MFIVPFAFVAIVCVLESRASACSCGRNGAARGVQLMLKLYEPVFEALADDRPADSNENDDDSSSIESFKNKKQKSNASNSNNQEFEQQTMQISI